MSCGRDSCTAASSGRTPSARRWPRSTTRARAPCPASRSCATAISSAWSRRPSERRAAPRPPSRRSGRRPRRQPSSSTIYDHLKKAPDGARAPAPFATGNVAEVKAARSFEASYRIPYIAHVPLEPRAAVAEWTEGKLTVWTGTQRPFGVRSELAEAFRIPETRVRVIVPDTGSAYGGKHTGEYADRSGEAREGRGPAGQARVDARRRVLVGLLQAGRRDRHQGRRRRRGDSWWPGNSTTGTPATPASGRRTTCRTSASRSIRRALRCGRARIAGWRRPPTTTRARCTWTRSRGRSAPTR